MGCPISTQTGTVRIVENCGKFSHELGPGCSCLWLPCFLQTVAGTISLRLQELRVKCETKTKDNVFITIQVSVQYQVQKQKVKDAFYELTDAKRQIEAYVFDVVRAEVPKKTLDHTFIEKEDLSKQIKQQLKDSMDKFGYEIISTPITDIDPDNMVKHAMNEINKQERLKQAAKEEAESKKMILVKAAEATAESIRIKAKANSDANYLSGLGLARQRHALINGLQESVKLFKEGIGDVKTEDVMDLILLTQYFDSLKDLGSTCQNVVFVPSSDSTSAPYRQGMLESNFASKITSK